MSKAAKDYVEFYQDEWKICERLQESFQPIVRRRVSEKTGKQLRTLLKSLTQHQDSRYLRGYKGLGGSQKLHRERFSHCR